MNSKQELQKILETYTCVLALPSYTVHQNPETFHTLVVEQKHYRGKDLVTLVTEAVLPGLASDPNISLPAGMFREWLKEKHGPRPMRREE